MNTATLKLETLHLIPALKEDFETQLQQLIADCKRRPGMGKARTLKVELTIKPHKTDPDDVWIQPVVSSKRPATTIDPIRGRRTRADQLQFDFAEGELEGS